MNTSISQDELDALVLSTENYIQGTCSVCGGDGREWHKNGDGSFGPPCSCEVCGGTGNIVQYVREVLLPAYCSDDECKECGIPLLEVCVNDACIRQYKAKQSAFHIEK